LEIVHFPMRYIKPYMSYFDHYSTMCVDFSFIVSPVWQALHHSSMCLNFIQLYSIYSGTTDCATGARL